MSNRQEISASEAQHGLKTQTSIPSNSLIPDPTDPESRPELTLPTQPVPTQPQELLTDDLGHALQFVKSVGGLANANRVLEELKAVLTGSN